MNDILKFRVWNKRDKRYIYDALYAYDGDCYKRKGDNDGHIMCFGEYVDDKNYDVEQYTGVMDKNEKLVFKGDIFKCSIDGYVQDMLFVVEDLRSFFFLLDREDPYYAVDWIEVVGNIHENPELLEYC